MNNTVSAKQELYFIGIIFCVCLALFFFNLGQRPLWEYDEAMHAQVAREMLQRADRVAAASEPRPALPPVLLPPPAEEQERCPTSSP